MNLVIISIHQEEFHDFKTTGSLHMFTQFIETESGIRVEQLIENNLKH